MTTFTCNYSINNACMEIFVMLHPISVSICKKCQAIFPSKQSGYNKARVLGVALNALGNDDNENTSDDEDIYQG